MAYGYNDGDQRPQSVRLAGRTTSTPKITSDNDNPQRPQEQLGASSRQQSRTVQQSDRVSTSTRQRQTGTSQPRRYDRRKTDYYVKRSFSRPQRDRGNSAPHPASHTTSHALPARRLRLALCSIAACLVFVFWDPVSPTDQPVLSPLPRTSCLKLPSRPVTPLRSRPHARNGRPAPCPTSTKLTPHGRSCPMPVALFEKTLAVPLASPWSISLRPATPIRRRSMYAHWPKPATTPPLVPPSDRL